MSVGRNIAGTSSAHDPTLAAAELGLHFRSRRGLDPILLRALVNISARLLDNIPDEVPTVLRPHALKNPMLDRLRTLLRDAELRASTQHAITPTGSPGKATSTRAVELAVLLQRAHEHFLPIEGDATNALRRDAWHGPVSSVQAEAAHSFEYTWFRRVGTVLQDTISNSLASPVMLQKHRESVRCARDTAARSVYSSAWSEV